MSLLAAHGGLTTAGGGSAKVGLTLGRAPDGRENWAARGPGVQALSLDLDPVVGTRSPWVASEDLPLRQSRPAQRRVLGALGALTLNPEHSSSYVLGALPAEKEPLVTSSSTMQGRGLAPTESLSASRDGSSADEPPSGPSEDLASEDSRGADAARTAQVAGPSAAVMQPEARCLPGLGRNPVKDLHHEDGARRGVPGAGMRAVGRYGEHTGIKDCGLSPGEVPNPILNPIPNPTQVRRLPSARPGDFIDVIAAERSHHALPAHSPQSADMGTTPDAIPSLPCPVGGDAARRNRMHVLVAARRPGHVAAPAEGDLKEAMTGLREAAAGTLSSLRRLGLSAALGRTNPRLIPIERVQAAGTPAEAVVAMSTTSAAVQPVTPAAEEVDGHAQLLPGRGALVFDPILGLHFDMESGELFAE